jgi:hypothetical protein
MTLALSTCLFKESEGPCFEKLRVMSIMNGAVPGRTDHTAWTTAQMWTEDNILNPRPLFFLESYMFLVTVKNWIETDQLRPVMSH